MFSNKQAMSGEEEEYTTDSDEETSTQKSSYEEVEELVSDGIEEE